MATNFPRSPYPAQHRHSTSCFPKENLQGLWEAPGNQLRMPFGVMLKTGTKIGGSPAEKMPYVDLGGKGSFTLSSFVFNAGFPFSVLNCRIPMKLNVSNTLFEYHRTLLQIVSPIPR